MSIVTHRIYEDASGVAACASCTVAKSYLVEALGSTLDSIDVGVIIVNGEARILHANQAAKRMLDQRSPIVSLGGCLGALRADLTKELRTAIATAQIENAHIGAVGIGVPLVDKEMTAATAHVLPLANARSHATHPDHMPTAAVFVARATASPLTDIRKGAPSGPIPAALPLAGMLSRHASLFRPGTADA